MRFLLRATFLLLILQLLIGCAAPAAMGIPITANQFTATPTLRLVVAAPDSTATPTPFQPLPPTEIYLPTDTPTPTFTPPPPTLTPTETPRRRSSGPIALEMPGSQVNILLLGADARPRQRIFRTDTIVLVTLNTELGTVNMTSFPRDLYVTLPNWGMNRINTAYEYGGFQMLSKTFEYNFGVRPDHYILINFSSFKEIVDGMGGLEVDVAQSVSDYRAGRWYTVPKGRVKMDADDVLWYVRTRKTSNDFARNRRQQEVLRAIFEKLISMDAVKRAPEFYNLYQENVTTDLTFTDMVPFLPLAAQVTEDPSRINQYFISPKEVYDWITPGGAMVLMPRQDMVMNVIRKALNLK